jgi:hypothetical protein
MYIEHAKCGTVRYQVYLKGQPTSERPNETTGGLQNGATQVAIAYRLRASPAGVLDGGVQCGQRHPAGEGCQVESSYPFQFEVVGPQLF